MATFVPARYVTLRGFEAIVEYPFAQPVRYKVVHASERSWAKAYFLYRTEGLLIETDYGVRGGGGLCSKRKVKEIKTPSRPAQSKFTPTPIPNPAQPTPVTKSTPAPDIIDPPDKCCQSTSMVPSDEEARDSFRDLENALQTADLSGAYQSASKLLLNSAEMDGQLVDLLIPALASGSIWNIGEIAGNIARQTLAQLLRIVTVRHAIRSHEQPGFRYSKKLVYSSDLERVIRKIEKQSKGDQDVDFQAELRASWAVVASIDDDQRIWDKLRRVLPKIAKLAALVDPIRYAGQLVDGIMDIGELMYDQYQDIKNSTLASSVVALTVLHSLRHNITNTEVEVLRVLLQKCNRWGIAVLTLRLLALMLEEGIVNFSIRMSLFELLEELAAFKRFVFRNNWKVRKAALYALVRLTHISIQEPELQRLIKDLMDMRLLLETDENVLVSVRQSTRFEQATKRLAENPFRTRMEREVKEIHSFVTGLYSTQHAKDESRLLTVAAEIRTAADSMKKAVEMSGPEISTRTAELQEAVSILSSRSQEMAARLESIKDQIDSPKLHVPQTKVRTLPQRNLEAGFFVGRGEELARLMQVFATSKARAVLLGEPGIGKSALALKFAYEAEKQQLFDNLIWIHAEKSSTIFADYREMAVDLSVSHGNDSEKVLYVKAHLKHNTRTLLIYDNADFEDQQGEREIDQFVRENFIFEEASVLVTSRNEVEWMNRISTHMRLARLSKEDGVKLLSTLSEMPEAKIQSELVERLDGHPLSLRTAGRYLRQSQSHNNLMEKLNSRAGPGLDRLMGVCVDTVTPQARMTLEACSFLNPDSIDSRLTGRLLRAAQVRQQYTTLAELESLSLLEMTGGRIEMHRMVQDSAYSICPDKDKEERERQVGSCLREIIATGEQFDPDMMLNARFYHDRRTLPSEDNRRVDQALVNYLLAKRLGAEAKRLADSIGEPESVSEAELLINLLQRAETSALTGLHDDAERYYKQAYDLAKSYPEKLFQVSLNLAKYKDSKGEVEMAKAYMENVLNTMSTVSLLPLQLGQIYALAGKLYSTDEKVERPREYLKKALELVENKAEIYVSLAEMYLRHVGYEPEAISALESGLVALQRTTTDPIHAKIYRLLAANTRADRSKPFDYLSKELSFRRVHMPDDPKGLVEVLLELGNLHMLKNQNQEALSFMREAELLLPSNDPLLAQVYEVMAKASVASGDNEEGLRYNDLKDRLGK